MNCGEDFRAAMRSAGLNNTSEVIADGKLHRFKSTGDNNRNSWYVLYAGPLCAGAFGCWKRGFTETWCDRNGNLSQAERNEVRRRWQEAQKERDRTAAEQRDKARKTAAWILGRSKSLADETTFTCESCGEDFNDDSEAEPLYECAECGSRFTRSNSADGGSHRCPDCNRFGAKISDAGCPSCGDGELYPALHHYLIAKGVQPHGDVREYRGALVLTLRDSSGELHSLQFIGADGTKRFLRGGRITGCFFTLADKPDGPLVVCEGYATGASIFEATGHAVVCAMNCGNLLAVSKALREKFPSREITVAADTDQWTAGNPGLTKATEAAHTIGARLAVPVFADVTTKPTDFNDLHQLQGLDIVKEQIESATTPKESDEDIITRLAALPPLEYERCRDAEAERLGIKRVSILDKLVDGKRPKKADTELQGTALDPWDDAVDGAALLDELRATYGRFIVLPPHGGVLLAVWTLLTFLFDQFSFTPYLHVISPEKECGKSTLAELMNHLCANATTPGGMSAAAMYRRIERVRPTLLLDEWDTLSDENRQAALNALNTGFKWNGVYTICVGDDHDDRDFHTFCPKAIFGLSEAKLPDTTKSRCFLFPLAKKLSTEKVEKLTRKFDGLILRRKCLRWTNDNRDKLQTEPVMPPGLSARQEDISEPLLAIADFCGGQWPALIRNAILHFCGEAKSEDGDVKRELLKDIREGFSKQPQPDRFSSAGIRDYLTSLEHRQWQDWNDGKGISQRQISDRLRSYQIASRNIKVAEGKVVKGYYLADFQEAFDRYLSPDGDSIRYPATKPENIEEHPLLQSATESNGSVSENVVPTNLYADGSGVADPKSESARADKGELVDADLL